MTYILILGWASARNKDFVAWLVECAEFQWYLPTGYMYDHRMSNESELDRDVEIDKLKKLDLRKYDVIIAKSMGTGLIAQLLGEWCFRDDVKVIFLWVPLRVAQELEFVNNYNNLKKAIIIQNEFDPTGSYQMCSDYFLSLKDVEVKCVIGNVSHSYEDFEQYLSLIVF